MAFTKINAAGIGTTETVTVDGLTVINDGSFGGNLTVSGVLTYEDVTNVDSVGLITARNGIVVGSGITLSKEGDVFFTGIATGNGSGLTALNASNLASGTVPTARLGSGTASSSTFLRGDSTFAAVTSTTISNNADNRLITGTGTANTINAEANITFDGTSLSLLDHKNIYLGDSNDLRIWHDANNSYSQISGQNYALYIDGASTYMRTSDGSSGVENSIVMNSNGSVDLYHSGTKKFETRSDGVLIGDSQGYYCGDGADMRMFFNGTDAFVRAEAGNLNLDKAGGGKFIVCKRDAEVELYHNNNLKAYTTSNGFKVETTSTDNARVAFKTSGHDYSQVGYFGLNRFGIDTHDGLEVRDASDSYAVRMRITSTGQFKQFADQDSANGQLLQNISNTNPEGLYIQFPNAAPNTSSRHFLKAYDSNSTRIVIDSNGNLRNINNSYGAISDISLKENIVDANSQWDDVKNIKVRVFNFKTESASDKRIGVVAQEIETVCPKLVDISYDKDEDGNLLETGVKSVKYSVLYMKAIKALQEAQTRIETLETKVAALEG